MPSISPWRLRFLIIEEEIKSHGIKEVVTIYLEGGKGQIVRRFNISVNYMTNFVMVPQRFALPVEGKKDWYIITPWPEPAGIDSPSLPRKSPGESVILAEKPDEWNIQYIPVDIGNGDVYELASRLDITFRKSELFQKGSPPGGSWSFATWEAKTHQRGRTPIMVILTTMCLSVFCAGQG